jgi:SpoIID/LytB domain protein
VRSFGLIRLIRLTRLTRPARIARIGASVAVIAAMLISATPAAAAPQGTLAATYQATPPATAGAGTTLSLAVTLTNPSGADAWNAGGANPVNLTYHWYDGAGNVVVWDGLRTSLGTDVPAGTSRTVTATVAVPAVAATYILKLALVKEGVAWLAPSTGYPVQAIPAYAASYGAAPLPSFIAGATYTIPVPVTNRGTAAWNATGPNLVDLAYHWHDLAGNTVVWDGERSSLPSDVAAGASTTVSARVTAPPLQGSYTLTFDLVREGVSWFQFFGSAPSRVSGVNVANASYAALYQLPPSQAASLGEVKTVAVTVTNNGNVAWNSSGVNPMNIAYHLFDSAGRTVVWDGTRTPLGGDLAPGASRTVNVAYTAPTAVGSFTLAIDTVREGVAWLSGLGSAYARAALAVTSGFNGGYDQTNTPAQATIGATLPLSVRVTNYGQRTWPAGGPNPVRLSYHIFTTTGAVVVWDGSRGNLAADIAPGQAATIPITVQLPGSTGNFRIEWDLVQDGVAWFSSLGVPRLVESFSVQPGVTFYGKGFGHGVGMSQYGAEGWATGASGPALNAEQIIAHYYTGTALTYVDYATNPRGPMRVLLSAPSSSGGASCGGTYMSSWLADIRSSGGFQVVNEAAGNAIVGVASPNVGYQIAAAAGIVKVYDQSTVPPTLKYQGTGPVTAVPTDPAQPITLVQKNAFFRGSLQFRNDGANALRVVNFVSYDSYVQGVIPKEMPAGWNIEAYKAQAYAARSYGFTSTGTGRDYDVRDDQLDQCYGGATVETTAGNQAVAATAGKVITYNGAAIRAYFSSSSGGYTVGDGCWNNGITCRANQPFLVPVADPADLTVAIPYANKHASWTVSFTSDQIRNALMSYGKPDIGALVSVDLSNQAPGGVGHVVSVKLRGSITAVEVPADVFLRTYLGMKSTLVRLSPF